MKITHPRLIIVALVATASLIGFAAHSSASLNCYSVGYAQIYSQPNSSTTTLQYNGFAAVVSAGFTNASVTPPGGATITSLQPHGGDFFEFAGTTALSSVTSTYPSGSYAFALTLNTGQTYHPSLTLNPAGSFPAAPVVSASGAGATWAAGRLFLQPNQDFTLSWTTPAGLFGYFGGISTPASPGEQNNPLISNKTHAYLPAAGLTQEVVTGGLPAGAYQFRLGFATTNGSVDGSYNPVAKQVTGSSVPNALGVPISATGTIVNIQVGAADAFSLFFQNGASLGLLNLNTTFLPSTWQGVGGMSTGWQERAVADINGDGNPDIIFQNGTLIGALILNANGTTSSWVGIGAMSAGWQLCGASYITGDGNLDLIFQNGTLLGYLEVNSSGQPMSWTGIGAMGTGWQLRSVASLDGTGRPDLIFQNGTALGALKVNTSGVPTAWAGIGAMGAGWTLSSAVDVNADGQPDLIFQSGTSLGALEVNSSLQPIAWHGIGSMGSGWTLPGDY